LSLDTEVEPKPVESDENKASKLRLSSLNPKKDRFPIPRRPW